MADVALSVCSKVAEFLVAPIGRGCSYLIFYESYVRQLKDEVANLDRARQRVQNSVVEAQNNMMQIEADVEKWVKDAESIDNEASNVLEGNEKAKKTRFCGWLINPKAHYHHGREARRTIEAIQALILQSQFEKVSYRSIPPGLVTGGPDVNSLAGDWGDTIMESRASILEDVMNALDDERVKVIGMHGVAGVGKTTLLREVEKKLTNGKSSFHMIVTARVSKNPDLKKIQDDIAFALGVDLRNEQSEVGRRGLLFRKLQSDPTKKVLIILDDLWEALDLKAVGIPSVEESRGCKLLLASRFEGVLELKMHADRTFHLEGLNNDDSFRLFEKMVGDRLKDDEELKAMAAQVIKKLAGLPLLIISVARTLKHSEVSAWRNALIVVNESDTETIMKFYVRPI